MDSEIIILKEALLDLDSNLANKNYRLVPALLCVLSSNVNHNGMDYIDCNDFTILKCRQQIAKLFYNLKSRNITDKITNFLTQNYKNLLGLSFQNGEEIIHRNTIGKLKRYLRNFDNKTIISILDELESWASEKQFNILFN